MLAARAASRRSLATLRLVSAPIRGPEMAGAAGVVEQAEGDLAKGDLVFAPTLRCAWGDAATVKVDAKAWSATCDPDGAGPETGGVYTCGLWSLFHAIAAAAPDRLATRDAIAAIRAVVAHFFGCETCKDHFLEMYDTCAHGRCDAAADASLWLWRAHNAVNVRVKGGADFEWPSPESCAQCKKDASWDEARVKVFLRRSYREGGASAHSFRRRAALP